MSGLTVNSREGDRSGRTFRKKGIDVSFSDSKFLERLLLEAQRNSSLDTAAARRLEGFGFGSDAVRIALHISGGDEKKATELCLSGFAFMDTDGGGLSSSAGIDWGGSRGALGAATVPPPPALHCYICGARHLQERTLDTHLRVCRRRFEERESKRPAGQRRRLLEACDLPFGVDCLEQLYEEDRQAQEARSASPRGTRPTGEATATTDLLPCEFCHRTFAPDRLETHQKACLQRPRQQTPVRKRPPSVGPTPPCAVRAYENFCRSLRRCPGCNRQFRPDALDAHTRLCCPEMSEKNFALAKSVAIAKSVISSGAQDPHPQVSTRTRSSPSNARRKTRSAGPSSPTRNPQKTSSKNGGVPFSFAPLGRSATGSPSAVSGASPSAPPLERNSGALMTQGLISNASVDDEAKLNAKISSQLPGDAYLAAFQVSNSSTMLVYDALKSSMQAQRGGTPPLELELWHGTSWAILPNILRHGFNRSFAGRHGTLYGVGTYFSSNPAYSLRFCDKRGGGADGTKVMLMTRVLVGDYCKGRPTDVEPPIKDEKTGQRYDSTVDSEEQPGIFAVFRDFQAVPLFLVEIKA